MPERKDGPVVLVTGRREGKSSELMGWLIEGETVLAWPHWSRGIIVADQRRADWLVRQNVVVRSYLDRLNVDMRNLFTVPGQYGSRAAAQDTEFAVDDAETILANLLGLDPVVLTLTGTLVLHLSAEAAAQEDDDA